MFYDLAEAAVEQIKIGGWVMGPLMVVSLWMWFLIAKKISDLYSFTKDDISVQECIRTMETDRFSAAYWQKKIVDGFLKRRTEDENMNKSILESLRVRQESNVKKEVGTIQILASIAPLLGLLGTVGGMITTFNVISEFGTGNARALASGISEALITTQTGLVVAVPGLFMASFLTHRTNTILERMQRFCLGLLRTHLGNNDMGKE